MFLLNFFESSPYLACLTLKDKSSNRQTGENIGWNQKGNLFVCDCREFRLADRNLANLT
jgi:hypothetical protein